MTDGLFVSFVFIVMLFLFLYLKICLTIEVINKSFRTSDDIKLFQILTRTPARHAIVSVFLHQRKNTEPHTTLRAKILEEVLTCVCGM